MNKKRIFIFCLLVFLTGYFYSVAKVYRESGSPFIQNYTDKDYGTNSPQNWSILQDARGVMYIANTEGVLEYDGKNWRLIKVSNNSIVWSLAKDTKGVIYVGAVGEFGYLAPDNIGRLSYISLLSKLKPEDLNCGDVKDVCITSEGVYFICKNSIIHYKNNTFNIIKTDLQQMKGFVFENTVYITQKDNGIYYIDRERLVFLPYTEQLKSNFKEYFILPFCKGKFLISIRGKGIFLYDKEKLDSGNASANEVVIPFITEADAYFKENSLLTGIQINNEQYAYGTLSGGIVITDRDGFLLQIINKNRGLQSNGVYALFFDKNNNLWAGLVNGISKIEINSPLTKFNELNGFEGLALSIKKHNNKTYIGTTNGIYYMPEHKINSTNDRYSFKYIKNTAASTWAFVELNNILYAPGPIGLLEVRDTTVHSVFECGQILSFTTTPKFPDIIFIGQRSGLAFTRFQKFGTGNVFSAVEEIQRSENPVWRTAVDENGDIWYSDKYSGLYHVVFSDKNNPGKSKVINYDTTNGLPRMDYNYPYFLENKLYIATQKGVFRAEKIKGSEKYHFFPDEISTQILGANVDVKQLTSDTAGRIWIQSDKNGMCYIEKNKNGVWKMQNKPFKSTGYVFRFYIDENNTVWMCTNHELYKYEQKFTKIYEQTFPSLIRKIVANNDSVLFMGYNLNDSVKLKSVLSYSLNTVSFEFSAPFYDNEVDIEFSYKLEGFDKSWSNWSKETKKEYTNLPEGDYVFRVKAKNIYDVESSEDSYKIKILAPFYRTYVAYAIYLIVFVLVIFGSIKIYNQRLIRKNIRLELLVKERTAEVEQQKEELSTQAEHLELNNRELEKLSIVASETSNAILIMDAEGNIEWINESFKRIYGFVDRDEYCREKGVDILKASSSPRIVEIINECLSDKKAVVYDNYTETKSGHKFWAQTTITPILDASGNIKKLVAIDSDITQIKEAEAEIKQQNEEITTQRELLAKANNELRYTNKLITDSIKYSKRIQEALLPSMKLIQTHFSDSFIFYKPRDIVSGDFYWMSYQANKVFFAIADCTGHGVPGALLSMIGSTILNELINEKGITSPSKILEYLSLRIVTALEKGREPDDIQSDGMDITLCCWDKDFRELKIASANGHACLYSKTGIQEVKADIYSIGDIFSHNQNIEYTTHTYHIEEGDMLYMYTDGYQDQFGKQESQKFMATRFEQMLTELQSLAMKEQLSKLSSTFEAWKGATHQTDDVLVMGIRFHSF